MRLAGPGIGKNRVGRAKSGCSWRKCITAGRPGVEGEQVGLLSERRAHGVAIVTPSSFAAAPRACLPHRRMPMERCAWLGDDPLMMAYHDDEWGVPVHDDRVLFEFLILEGAQAALSWITILILHFRFPLPMRIFYHYNLILNMRY